MRLAPHSHAGHNMPRVFSGRGSRIYNAAATTLFRPMYRRIATDAARLAPQGAAVLDVGTGPGVLLVELARLRPDLDLTGIDLSDDMVTAATRNLATFGTRARAQVADVGRLPFPDGTFDMIVSSFSLHHWDDPAAAVPELARVLRPGGRMYIYDAGFAPFDALTSTARNAALFTGQPPQLARIRIGPAGLLRPTRLEMSTPDR